MIGDLTDNKIISVYNPPQEVRDLTIKVREDYRTGYNILHTSYSELNDKNPIERADLDQKVFNVYTEPKSSNPLENWKWKGRRPMSRNKIISIAAHLTASVLFPNVFPQNSADDEDKMAANVMKDLIEWNIRNSDYEISFLFAVISALVNPASVINVEFAEVMQKVRVKAENGEITIKEAVDEMFSGLKFNLVPVDELLINNVYEFEIQKQKCLIRKRIVDYSEMQGKYGSHENFIHVKPGVKVLYSEDDGTFYEEYDEQHPTLIEEAIYYNRGEDLEVPFVNGIYMGKENTEANWINHRRIVVDENGEMLLVPVYSYVKFIDGPIDEKRFFYGKSRAFSLFEEQGLLDAMYRLVMDGTFLQVIPPMAGFGTGRINASVIYPGAVTPFKSDAKLESISTGANLNWAYTAIEKLESSMTESTQSNIRAGIPESERRTAWEVARMEQNARIQLGLLGKMVAKAVVELGYLMIDIILNHQTVASMDELLGGDVRMKYRTFFLPDKTEDGKKITKKIVFTDEFMGKKMTKEQKLKEAFKMKKEVGNDVKLSKVNPHLFSRMKFMLVVEADNLLPKNEAFEKAIKLELYDRAIQNPYVDHEAITRDFLLETYQKGEADKYLKKEVEKIMGVPVSGKPKSSALVEQMMSSPAKSLKGITSTP